MKHTFTKVLSIVLALAMCMSTFAMLGVSAATTCDHTNPTEETAEYYGYQDPDCTNMGGHMWKCKTCGEEFATEVVAPLGHDTTGPEATCQNAKVCAREGCGVVLVPKQPHSPKLDKNGKAIVYTKAADCTKGEEGYKYNVCKWCEAEINKTDIVSGDHNMDYKKGTVVKAPTCTEPGEMKFVCQNKGCDYEEIVRINPDGHKFGALVTSTVPTTCDTEYLKDHYRCTVCEGYFDTAYNATTKAALTLKTGHLDTNTLVQTIAGTCTTKETEKHFCEVCEKNWDVEKDYFHAVKATHKTDATCTKYGYIYHICQLCGQQVGQTEVLNPTGHSKKIGDVVPATCTTASYQLWECTYTNEENHANGVYTEYIGTALGHTMKLYQAEVASTCTQQGTAAIYRCERYADCGHEVVGTTPAPVAHKYVKKVYAPTCISDGYTIEECEMCGATKPGAVKTDVIAKDPNAHDIVENKVMTPAQCGQGGIIAAKYCTRCHYADQITYVDPLVHNYSKFVSHDMLPTCMANGLDTYSCTNTWVDPTTGKTVTCGATTQVATYMSDIKPEDFETAEEYTNAIAACHERCMAADGSVAVALNILRPGTCMIKELVLYKCVKCNLQYEKNTTYGHTSTDEFPTHTPATDTVGKAAECWTETNGYKAGGLYCVECTAANGGVKVWWKGEAPEVIKFVHNEDGSVGKVAQDCENAGNKAFKYCTVCEANNGVNSQAKMLAKNIIPADGHKDVLKAEVPATCGKPEAAIGTTGMKAHRFCDVCDTYFAADLDKDGKLVKLNQNEIDALVIPALTHNYVENKVVVKFVDCTKISYVYYECTLCGDQYVNTFIDEAAHKWNSGVKTPATCTTAGYTTYTCTVVGCGKTAKNVNEGDALPALKHYNKADNKLFVGLCTENLTDKDTYACDRADCPDNGVVTIKHNNKAVSKVVPATCTLPGYTIYICSDCEKSFLEDYTELAKHTPVIDQEQSYDATYTTAGLEVKICDVCKTELSRTEIPVKTGVQVTLTADSAIKSGYHIVNGGKVQFTVALTTKSVWANNVAMTFHYSNNLSFESIEFAGVFGESEQQFYYADDWSGVLNVSSWAPNTTDKKLQNMEIAGENVTYAVITFTIDDDAAYETATLTVDPIELLDIDNKTPAVSETATASMAISMLGNADGINMSNVPYFSANDALVIRRMIEAQYTAVEGAVIYSAEADIDMDGDVDGDDFILLNKALVQDINPLYATLD